MSRKIMDIHNHTTWSDGVHTTEEIIENAINNGVDIIGISDHFNTIKCNSISIPKLHKYIEFLWKMKDKYKDKIKVLSGIEICMNKEWCELNNLPYNILSKLDYVLFEYIDWFSDSVTLKEIQYYTKRISCPKGLAHTNIFSLIDKYEIDNVIKLIKDNELFWELNVNEGYEYFDYIINNRNEVKIIELFNKLKENDIKISVGSDTHALKFYDINKIKIGNELAAESDITKLNIIKQSKISR